MKVRSTDTILRCILAIVPLGLVLNGCTPILKLALGCYNRDQFSDEIVLEQPITSGDLRLAVEAVIPTIAGFRPTRIVDNRQVDEAGRITSWEESTGVINVNDFGWDVSGIYSQVSLGRSFFGASAAREVTVTTSGVHPYCSEIPNKRETHTEFVTKLRGYLQDKFRQSAIRIR